MVRRLFVLFSLGIFFPLQQVSSENDGDERLKVAFRALNSIPAGKELVNQVVQQWRLLNSQDLIKSFRWGEASRTDAILTRKFNPKTGMEQRERLVTVYIRRGQSLEDLILDIAHELVHATARPSWDPYDPNLTPGKYIWASIEAEGGEIDAVQAECRVGLQLLNSFGSSVERCRSYLDESGKRIVREKIRRDFYRIGKWDLALREKLGVEQKLFPLMSEQSPRLFSSTGGTPYPVALMREFEELTEVACENSKRRTELDREPASPVSNDARFLLARCSAD